MTCICFVGDVMLGRGVDQILAHPCLPHLYEPCVRDARTYVALAERRHGGPSIPRPVHFDYIWGDCLDEWKRRSRERPLFRIVNLETSVTTSERCWMGKGINYRASPRNAVGCLQAADIDCCVLANNHVLDWGYEGLCETVHTLRAAGIATCGAGANSKEASKPAVLTVPRSYRHENRTLTAIRRILVFAYASPTSGVPEAWAATPDRAGVNFVPELTTQAALSVIQTIRDFLEEGDGETSQLGGDVIVVSIHWGPNWGFEVSREQREFAHTLAQHGVDIVYGHSSHHIKAVEHYRCAPAKKSGVATRLSVSATASEHVQKQSIIFYGCGDFINDYEGIDSHDESYCPDLGAAYFVDVDDPKMRVEMVAFRRRLFRLEYASDEEQLCAEKMSEWG